ncbi:sensor domain-containing diguanylate cyclase [Granulosicoccus antarcticus]|uniref:Putative diguanylate cyclase YeaP n=1 Tax=Granulosicoccus antarcticus IMCC3135 TaxID=1192854 RepID=A0A2Z2P722_9GAMM|nr:sensor domain-containing diguanylate cyclase [Granulosicoccus antarcticus]ASJ75654.1 putative diguanylate cyclase YeaP [Granulosicoccus antarcticus IMCC3135]
MIGLSGATLRQMLTIPYVALVLIAASIIGLLSYLAGLNAVNTLSNYALSETVSRIAQAVDKHIEGSEAVLETAFPTDMLPPTSVKDDLTALRTRLWLATTIHRNPNNYAYYGDKDGQFIGLYRFNETDAELRLRTNGESPRSIYTFSRIFGQLGTPVTEERIFEPRERPWYKAGQSTTEQTWTAIYIDFKTLELVSTRARRVNNAEGEFQGVVATDVSLELLNDFLRSLTLTPNGFAFIVEPDGNLVATSRGPHIQTGVNNDNSRLNAAQSSDPLLAAAFQSLRKQSEPHSPQTKPMTSSFEGPDGKIVQTGYFMLRDSAGLDWTIVVAVPRSDFMHSVEQNVQRTAWLSLAVCALIALVGLVVLNIISRDLRQLAKAAKALGEGNKFPNIPVHRKDGIGELARSFAAMQERLLTDRLTGIPNREAVIRRIEDRIIQNRRRRDSLPFVVMFVDLNGFKAINDRYGHEVGDRVLVEVSQRLEASLRLDDLAARYGGDEFIVMLNEVSDRNDAIKARTKLEIVLAEPLQSLAEFGETAAIMTTGAAIGLALCPEDGNDLDTLLNHADQDMYQRKQITSKTPV